MKLKDIVRHPRHAFYRLLRWYPKAPPGTVCFVIPEESKGWILEAACNEIARRIDAPTMFWNNYKTLPKASAYFFSHYHFYIRAMNLFPWLADSNCVVWFTHPKEPGLGGVATIDALRNTTVVTMSSSWREYLIEMGLEQDNVVTIVGAADPDYFGFHQRGSRKVGFCTAYYERKSPERILETIKLLPDVECILLGRRWEEYTRFDELQSLRNFEYRESSYEDYPEFYREIDVFVSASELEGGPIPLLEAMMSNAVPVASDTGFAPDVIKHGVNGFLFPADVQDCNIIANLVRQALRLEGDVRNSVLEYSWDSYAHQHEPLFRTAA